MCDDAANSAITCYSRSKVSHALTKVAPVLLALMVVINAQCLAACSLEPCRPDAAQAQSKKASAPSCHQTTGNQQESQGNANQSCSHEAVASESVAKVLLPQNVPSAAVWLLPAPLTPDAHAFRIAVTNSSPPLTRALASSTVLRI